MNALNIFGLLDGIAYATFKEACEVLGVFDNDKEYILVLRKRVYGLLFFCYYVTK